MVCCLNPDCQKPLNQDADKFCQSCGTELISLLRHRYKITKPLGQGGFGKTYLAEDTDKLKRHCVVKQLFYQGQSSNANQKIVELFMREAEQLDQLKANQQIPDLLAYFEENGFLYLVQEYIDGQDLLKELKQEGSFSEAKIEALLQDLLPVLAFIHEKGVIHRDLKPENIMRRKKDGRLMLIDFGVARQISMSQLTVTGTKVGSPGYFSVEQFAEGKATASSDLYSIGATVFHLLTGQYPGDLWTMQGYGWVNSWQDHLSHGIDIKLVPILDKLLQVRAEDRYQSADEVLADLSVYSSANSQTLTTPIQSQPQQQTAKSFTQVSQNSVEKNIQKQQSQPKLSDNVSNHINSSHIDDHTDITKGSNDKRKRTLIVGSGLGAIFIGVALLIGSGQLETYEAPSETNEASSETNEAPSETNEAPTQETQIYQEALDKNPNDPKALLGLSRHYSDLAEFDKALPLMEKLASLQPEKVDYLFELAGLYPLNGDKTKEEETYDRILKLEPNNILALTSKAVLRVEQGDSGAAKALFTRAEKAAPTDRLKQEIRQMADKAQSSSSP